MTETADKAFADPRLAMLYDFAEDDRQDLPHYVRLLAELGATSVVDIGCGTGTLAMLLAARGAQVTGVDPAAASLAIARRKDERQLVQWVHGDTETLAVSHEELIVDAAIMTGNVAQVFVTDEHWDATLVAARDRLRPGGHLIFEVRDPAAQGWLEWTRSQSITRISVPDVGEVESWVELTEVAWPLVSFAWTYCFEHDGTRLRSSSTLRFRERAEITATLARIGFDVIDVRDAPDRPGKEFVFIARTR